MQSKHNHSQERKNYVIVMLNLGPNPHGRGKFCEAPEWLLYPK